ncbi:hypothetical protein PR048_019691 [Dryococelus australis]|uniref:PiggyBac transposable element-derived protein domain-containing protein n=1 Tax=Dryococelus australis TaxID=614101 RepID=A0ABQ9H4A5_9NEOP|nr:hypothetical protein PR048_019691 [Dryococelus australis]
MPSRNDPNCGRLFKIRPLVDEMQKKFKYLPLCQMLCVDEPINLFKGKSALKQYNPKKTRISWYTRYWSFGTIRVDCFPGLQIQTDKEMKKRGSGAFDEVATKVDGTEIRALKLYDIRGKPKLRLKYLPQNITLSWVGSICLMDLSRTTGFHFDQKSTNIVRFSNS